MPADYLPFEPPDKPKIYWHGQLILSPGNLPDPGIEPGSPEFQADSLLAELPEKRSFSSRFFDQTPGNLIV